MQFSYGIAHISVWLSFQPNKTLSATKHHAMLSIFDYLPSATQTTRNFLTMVSAFRDRYLSWLIIKTSTTKWIRFPTLGTFSKESLCIFQGNTSNPSLFLVLCNGTIVEPWIPLLSFETEGKRNNKIHSLSLLTSSMPVTHTRTVLNVESVLQSTIPLVFILTCMAVMLHLLHE